FRTGNLPETIKFGAGETYVSGTVIRGNEIERELQVVVQPRGKKTSINGKRESRTLYAAQLHAFCFTSDELEVIRGGPEARRGFLDRGVISLHPAYAQTLADYNRVIKQKKRLLQQAAEGSLNHDETAAQIEPWNTQLVDLGNQIHKARTEYVGLLS